MLLTLPALLGLSGIFSGSETALFNLRAHDRELLRSRRDRAARDTLRLLAEPRMLLITLLLGNMLVNVTYFVVTSALLLRMDAESRGAIVAVAASLTTLLAIILVGEVGPKLVAARAPLPWMRIFATPLMTFYRLLGPVREGVTRFIIGPLITLVAPPQPPPKLSTTELNSLLEVSRAQGAISNEERELLEDVIALRRRKVRDVMTPRVSMTAVQADWSRDRVIDVVRRAHAPRVPIYRSSLDDIVGMLDVRALLLDPKADVRRAMITPAFVPEIISLDQLLDEFRRTGNQTMVAVDELGQTVGLVSLLDAMEELVGEGLAGRSADGSARSADGGSGGRRPLDVPPVHLIELGRWLVPGATNVHDLAEWFDIDLGPVAVATVGGLINDRLGRLGEVGESVQIAPDWWLTIKSLERRRVAQVLVELRVPPPPVADAEPGETADGPDEVADPAVEEALAADEEGWNMHLPLRGMGRRRSRAETKPTTTRPPAIDEPVDEAPANEPALPTTASGADGEYVEPGAAEPKSPRGGAEDEADSGDAGDVGGAEPAPGGRP